MNGNDRPAERVLVVDDEPEVRQLLSLLVAQQGLEPIPAGSGKKALHLLEKHSPALMLLDLLMPEMGGLAVLQEALRFDAGLPVVLVTGDTSVPSVVEAMKHGAFDYLTKPFQKAELDGTIQRAMGTRRMGQAPPSSGRGKKGEGDLRQLMGPSEQIGRLLQDLHRVAATDFTVVITGETGAGKELVARALHQQGHRAFGPFVPVDCGAIQANLIESELFGHERGAFTGADRTRQGRFEAARGGTLFLDEVQNLPLEVQTRFLRALQERQFCRLGAQRATDIDVRVVVATNEGLEGLVQAGKFRRDLYYRLNEFGLRVPPLRERVDDVLYLASRFIDLAAVELGKERPGLGAEAAHLLLSNPWPGNVRELRNVVRRAVLLADREIEPYHLATMDLAGGQLLDAARPGRPETLPGAAGLSFKERVRRSVAQAERAILIEALRQTGGNKAKAARLLQIDYKTIHTKARQYGIPLGAAGAETNPDAANRNEEDEVANGA